MPLRRTIPALVLASVTLALAGCAGTVNVPAAPEANAPECADLMVRLPQQVAGAERRWTDSQATAAWGDPATIIFSCGVASPGPTTLRCESVAGVDWVIDESEAPRFRVVTYGRKPAVELYFNTETSQVEQGYKSDWTSRMGPYRTREEAENALSIAARRNKEWERAEREWNDEDNED